MWAGGGGRTLSFSVSVSPPPSLQSLPGVTFGACILVYVSEAPLVTGNDLRY